MVSSMLERSVSQHKERQNSDQISHDAALPLALQAVVHSAQFLWQIKFFGGVAKLQDGCTGAEH
jgi:hypothetical protein